MAKYRTTEQYIKALDRLSDIESRKWPKWQKRLSNDFDRKRNTDNPFGRSIEQEQGEIKTYKIKLLTMTPEEKHVFLYGKLEEFLAPREHIAKVGIRQVIKETNVSRWEDYESVMRRSGASEEDIAKAREIFDSMTEYRKNQFFNSGYNQAIYFERYTEKTRAKAYFAQWLEEMNESLYLSRLEDFYKDKVDSDYEVSYIRSTHYNKETEGKGVKPYRRKRK